MEFIEEKISLNHAPNNKTALIDADSLIYSVAYDSEVVKSDSIKECEDNFNNRVDFIKNRTGCKDVILFITSIQNYNFRYKLYYPYKDNRVNRLKPKIFIPFKDYIIRTNQKVKESKIAEPDDYIVALHRENKDKYIIASIDKDVLNNCEGEHYNFKFDKFIKVDALTSFLFPFIQALTGDSVDNVAGLKNFGVAKGKQLKDLIIQEYQLTNEKIKSMTDIEKEKLKNVLFSIVFNLYRVQHSNHEVAFRNALMFYRLVNMEQLNIKSNKIELKVFDFDSVVGYANQTAELTKKIKLYKK